MSEDFYEKMSGFTEFGNACDPQYYHPAPEDWFVVITDVKDSTKAIEKGRYKDVNMVGAACITAVVNICGPKIIPYVFGGDGATMLIPPTHIDDVKQEMLAVQHVARKIHDLDMRRRCCSR